MFGPCKACKEKDARIADLKEQIGTYKSLLLPQGRNQVLPVVHLEQDAVLSGREEIIPVDSEEIVDIQREADRILAGNY